MKILDAVSGRMHWCGSALTQTMPTRAFLCAGTSRGHLDDKTKKFTCPSIFGSLTTAKVPWKIYGYTSSPLTKEDFPDTVSAPAANYGKFSDFQADCAAGSLPAYSFLEASWSSKGNSQHPNYNMALGEQLLLDTYRVVRDSPAWDKTLLVITYDEHGGCYDHVSPPWGATPPDDSTGECGFDFTRFGPRGAHRAGLAVHPGQNRLPRHPGDPRSHLGAGHPREALGHRPARPTRRRRTRPLAAAEETKTVPSSDARLRAPGASS